MTDTPDWRAHARLVMVEKTYTGDAKQTVLRKRALVFFESNTLPWFGKAARLIPAVSLPMFAAEWKTKQWARSYALVQRAVTGDADDEGAPWEPV